MTAAQFEDLRVDEAAEVLAWRFDRLCRCGFDLDAAAVIAANVEVDLHSGGRPRRTRLPARHRGAHPLVVLPNTRDVGITAAIPASRYSRFGDEPLEVVARALGRRQGPWCAE